MRLIIKEINDDGSKSVSSFIVDDKKVYTELSGEEVGEVSDDGDIIMELHQI